MNQAIRANGARQKRRTSAIAPARVNVQTFGARQPDPGPNPYPYRAVIRGMEVTRSVVLLFLEAY